MFSSSNAAEMQISTGLICHVKIGTIRVAKGVHNSREESLHFLHHFLLREFVAPLVAVVVVVVVAVESRVSNGTRTARVAWKQARMSDSGMG